MQQRISLRPVTATLLVTFLLLAVFSCTPKVSPEQQLADSLLVKAREAIGRQQYLHGKEILQQALVLDRAMNRTQQLAEEGRLLGDIYVTAAEFDSALFFYNQSYEHYKLLGDRQAARSLTVDIGNLHRWMGDERKAYDVYSEALRLARVFKDSGTVREIQWYLLPVCRALGFEEEQSRIIVDLQNLYTSSHDLRMLSRVRFESGLSMLHSDRYVRAVDEFLQTLSLSDQARDSLLAISTLLHLAISYDALNRQPDAFHTFTEALKRADITRGAQGLREEMLIRVGNIYLRARRFDDAARFYRVALSSSVSAENKLGEGYLYLHLGHCDVQKSRDDAIKKYESALEMFDALSYAPGSIYARVSLGYALQRASRYTDALANFTAAVEMQDALMWTPHKLDLYRNCEEAFYSFHDGSVYDAAIQLLLQLGRYDEAFWYAERKKGKGILNALSPMQVHARDSVLAVALARYNHARSRRIGAERQFTKLMISIPREKDLFEVVLARLERAGREVDAAAAGVMKEKKALQPAVNVAAAGLAEVQRLLPRGTALITHIPTQRSLYVFVVTNSRAAVQVAAVEKQRLGRDVAEFTYALEKRNHIPDTLRAEQAAADRQIQELTSRLYGAFIRPIEGLLSGISKVIVCPDEVLAPLPVHALRSPMPRSRYVGELFDLSYLPSALSLSMESSQPRADIEVVGLGHPGRTDWDVEYELRDIRAFYKDARLYFNERASLSSLLNEHGDVIHLAADFSYNPDAPGNSFLLLSDGKSAEITREVRLGQLFLLPPFPIVIISDLSGTAQRVELQRPMLFLMNGSGYLFINSYVPARKTKKFFGEILYTTLLGGGRPQGAYRKALAEMIGKPEYSSPHVWAPFFLWGK
jgi:tetratricopeptide (TPR) repeat protein/CHAT domain-containing protein